MKRKVLRERPFEFLRYRNGNKYTEDIVKNWYKSRVYVLEKLKDIAFVPKSDSHLQVVVEGDSPLMLSVVRSVALYAHYLNFEEEDFFGNIVAKNRTVITLVSQNENIDKELAKEEYLCNLMDCCRWSKFGGEMHNPDSYLDIEVQIVREAVEDNGAEVIRMSEHELVDFIGKKDDKDVYTIDTRKAVMVGKMYELGSVIDNLPAEDIHSAKRYTSALDAFQNLLLKEELSPLVNEKKWDGDVRKVKNGISSIFCADCFESRALAMSRCGNNDIRNWERYNMELSVSEHARWVTERLIMGFRPFSTSESYQFESLFGKKRNIYSKMLKDNALDQAHLDICSFRDLRRINPGDMIYDSFLLLAIPRILEKIRREDK